MKSRVFYIFFVLLIFSTVAGSTKNKKRVKKHAAPISQHFVEQEGIPFSEQMEGSGEKPSLFSYFNLSVDSLTIASRYLPKRPIIVEAGAFDGKESCIMASFWPKGHVHCFEPIQTLFKNVKMHTRSFPNISSYNLALGDEIGEKIMYLSNEIQNPGEVSMSSSLFPPKDHLLYAPTQFEGQEVVHVTTLDHWANENNIPKVDMLWLDMQGAELAALKAAPNVLRHVSVILTELEFVEAYEGQPLYREVRSWLEEQGFVLVAGNFKFPKHPTQWFGDGLFVRKELIK